MCTFTYAHDICTNGYLYRKKHGDFDTEINLAALLFYFVLLWEVFPRSKQIGFVVKAVIMGGAQLLALFGMLLVFTYWFGVVGFVAFPDKFQFRRAEVVDGSTVQNSVEAGAFNAISYARFNCWNAH